MYPKYVYFHRQVHRHCPWSICSTVTRDVGRDSDAFHLKFEPHCACPRPSHFGHGVHSLIVKVNIIPLISQDTNLIYEGELSNQSLTIVRNQEDELNQPSLRVNLVRLDRMLVIHRNEDVSQDRCQQLSPCPLKYFAK